MRDELICCRDQYDRIIDLSLASLACTFANQWTENKTIHGSYQ